ncbi:MAG: endonuclease MutS2 [Pyrinomonadaceae bacterium]|nr:endonuclease MutS2 [Pyrinomonadaceae bacterium]
MNSLNTLEYNKLLKLISAHAQTPMGKSYLENLEPLTNRLQLEKDLQAISETILLNEEKQVSWNFSGLSEPNEAIAILKIKNATLEPLVLLEVTRICNQALFARSVISPEKDFVPNLWKIVENIPQTLFTAIQNINKKLLPSGEIDDTASPELARLRREINLQRGRLEKTLESLMRANSDAIQDAIVTQRNERFVVPVKADFRGKLQGVAHGFSSSGQTMFIEPLEVIDANNELAGLKAKEESEISRILFSLTEELRSELPNIENAIIAVAELDFVKAKVEFARKFNAIVPKISDDGTLELIDARHPLLENNLRNISPQINTDEHRLEKTKDQKPKTENQIVPNSFKLTKQNSVMIISGANAGGKTVVMKTAGLLALMAISGLPVPAKNAVIPFYASVLADIGDHQSLSANLSTFSSHISNIAEMMKNLPESSLVLLDEVGTGTDPDEGSALGVAIVDYFRQKGSQIIASTHYKGLKIYAANDENVINASVEFNEKTLQPTYRLLQGFAGASSGIEIAKRFGILPQVVDKARLNLDRQAKETEQFLLKIRRESQTAEDLRIALEEEREAVATQYAKLDIEAGKRERERQKEFDKKFAETLDSFDKQTKAFLQTIEDKALKSKLEKETAARKSELKRFIFDAETKGRGDGEKKSITVGRNIEQPKTENRKIILGDKVLTSFGNVGKVEKIDGEMAEILVGSMRLREKLKNLQVVVSEEVSQTSKLEKLQQQATQSNIKLDVEETTSELNLIGKRTDEADYLLDKFLDESYMSGLRHVRIIHGFGTGALKNFVHHYLKTNDHVIRFAFAEQNQGGHGATVVELKQ